MATPIARFKDLCIDAVDPAVLGRFWAGLLRLDLEQRADGLVRLTGARTRSRRSG